MSTNTGTFSPNYKLTIGVDFSLKTLDWDSRTKVQLQLWYNMHSLYDAEIMYTAMHKVHLLPLWHLATV